MHDFELFHMKPSETIGDTHTRFTDIVNGLKPLGKSFSDFKLINKILKSFPKSWNPKATVIQEANDLNDFPLEELIGSLITYEMSCITQDEYENNFPKNRKYMALRTKECHLSDNSSDDDDDIELLMRKLKKIIKQETKDKNELKRNTITCYECINQLEHLKSKCPQQKKKKAFKAA